jgi:serine/threonine protein kinase
LADFGLALPLSQGSITVYRGHARWMAPELWPGHTRADQISSDCLVKSDMYSYGLVMLFLITGTTPWDNTSEESICPFDESMKSDGSWPSEPPSDIRYTVPSVLASELQNIVNVCYVEDPLKRATSELVHGQFFWGMVCVGTIEINICTTCYLSLSPVDRSNPFSVTDISSEFFSCGFLGNTQIFVADSIVTEVNTPQDS